MKTDARFMQNVIKKDHMDGFGLLNIWYFCRNFTAKQLIFKNEDTRIPSTEFI